MNKRAYSILVAVTRIHARQVAPSHLNVGEIEIKLVDEGMSCHAKLVDPEGHNEGLEGIDLNITWEEITELLQN
jgi:hypothetical protein